MSPILVRPVREQLEHDRVIRQLQVKHKRKFDVVINPGNEQHAPVGNGPSVVFPDLVLHSLDRGRKLQAVIEVETGESVNHLEALAEWAVYSRLRAAFHLYVPSGMVEVARRLCEDNKIYVSEIWSYHAIGDEIRFTMVHRSKEAPPAPKKPSATAPAAARAASGKPAARKAPAKAARKAPTRAAAKRAKPAKKSKRK